MRSLWGKWCNKTEIMQKRRLTGSICRKKKNQSKGFFRQISRDEEFNTISTSEVILFTSKYSL